MAVVATGFFDGVHLGHRQVVRALVSEAASVGEESLVVTFAQHPRAVLQQDATKLRLLSSRDEKIRMLMELGVDRVEVVNFTREFAAKDAASYIREELVGRFGASKLVLGYDSRMGSDRLGPSEIVSLASSIGLPVVLVPPLSDSDVVVSSTKIRTALEEGRVDDAASMLGYEYGLRGVVVPGKRLGRTIGFPTANLGLADPLRQLPGRGVYLTHTEVMGCEYLSMTNVGDIIETNIFDFEDDIYSLEISVRFVRKLRDMRSFSSLEELRGQLMLDRQTILQSI